MKKIGIIVLVLIAFGCSDDEDTLLHDMEIRMQVFQVLNEEESNSDFGYKHSTKTTSNLNFNLDSLTGDLSSNIHLDDDMLTELKKNQGKE